MQGIALSEQVSLISFLIITPLAGCHNCGRRFAVACQVESKQLTVISQELQQDNLITYISKDQTN